MLSSGIENIFCMSLNLALGLDFDGFSACYLARCLNFNLSQNIIIDTDRGVKPDIFFISYSKNDRSSHLRENSFGSEKKYRGLRTKIGLYLQSGRFNARVVKFSISEKYRTGRGGISRRSEAILLVVTVFNVNR